MIEVTEATHMTKVVILCGGMGTRLKEETEYKPKPLVEIGGKPILWHIMKHYSHYGFKDFILCLGYKGDMIKNYFIAACAIKACLRDLIRSTRNDAASKSFWSYFAKH